MKTTEEKIKEELKKLGTYSTSLDFQITTLATAMESLAKARKEAASLDKVTVIETSRYGQKVSPHPVFKVMRDAEASITRQLKALGLTTIDVMENGTPQDDDPMVKLMNQLSD